MKKLVGLMSAVIGTFFLHAGDVYAGERVNSKESLRMCKSAMEAKTGAGMRYKFKRNSATSVDADRYTHWINLLEISDTGKSQMKLLCKTSRSGEILELEVKPGKWKI